MFLKKRVVHLLSGVEVLRELESEDLERLAGACFVSPPFPSRVAADSRPCTSTRMPLTTEGDCSIW